MTSRAAVFAATFAVLFAAHQVADYWVQTDDQARNKGEPGSSGRRACAGHVASYTAVTAGALEIANAVLGLRVPVAGRVAVQAVSAATHYAADRREHGLMMQFARRCGKGAYLDNGGAAPMDQAWHIASLAVAAGVAAVSAQ
ncbi:hypothetical protein FHR81_003183 [Actinoalloteichus hoggarensis]|uniref:Uncharacterized protein n=1 Tax=Actinoalloteichus hoggarensis TaxID=1470176 RepID=A0A221W6F1_9PSEU|nr:DUF3307 domain-containing protein [Actinoalloteichus hoggarensis]ASO21540.1 hypothetical protein AHOG_19590 [Actinoalloteichus hoggarensis]MBB5922131.1 hypothetical protein [Actinoalloteichus hoggarensis]